MASTLESTPYTARETETQSTTESSSGPGRHVNSFAIWQPDKDVQQCLNCQRKFTIFLRRHHCRCCGGVFCGYCVSKFATYDRRCVKVVCRPGWGEEDAPYRTCDACYENLMSLGLVLQPRRPCLRDYIDPTNDNDGDDTFEIAADRNTPRSSPTVVKSSGTVERVVELRSGSNIENSNSNGLTQTLTQEEVTEELLHCPICNIKLSTVSDGSEEAAQEHVERCIACAEMNQQHKSRSVNEEGIPETGDSSSASFSPAEFSLSRSPAAKNRMLVYRVASTKPTKVAAAEKDAGEYPECPICFEEMKPGDKVGRLECLCVFHYKCIKRWLIKRTQKLKPDDARTVIGKNFCPLHDAIY